MNVTLTEVLLLRPHNVIGSFGRLVCSSLTVGHLDLQVQTADSSSNLTEGAAGPCWAHELSAGGGCQVVPTAAFLKGRQIVLNRNFEKKLCFTNLF